MREQWPQKGLRDGGDDADFAAAVGESVAAGGFGRGVGGQGDEARGLGRVRWAGSSCTTFGCQMARRRVISSRVTTAAGLQVRAPGSDGGLFEGHPLDEADDDVFRAREKAAKDFDLRLVEAAQEDAVDLDGAEAGGGGGTDAGEDAVKGARDAGDGGEGFGVDGVHGDGDAGQAGVAEGLGELGEEVAVGGEGDVEGGAGEGAQGGEGADEVEEAGAEEGLAAGETDFFDAERDEEADEAEVIGDGELGEEGTLVAGTAVDAAIVAAVGDGDAEVSDGAAVAVAQGLEDRRRAVGRGGRDGEGG